MCHRPDLGDEFYIFDWLTRKLGRSPMPALQPELPDMAGPAAAGAIRGPWSDTAKARKPTKTPCSLRSMKLADLRRAMSIAADNFRGEVSLVARSYLWHFSRRAGLGNVGVMWRRRSVDVVDAGRALSFDLLSSFVHDRDVAWIDLGGRTSDEIAVATRAFRHWPKRHRLLVVRVDWPRAQQLLDAGFQLSGRVPEGDGEHLYVHAATADLVEPDGSRPTVRFGRARRVAADCDFGVVERDGTIVGLTGVYRAGFWRDVTWGAWGAVDRACARRDAVFEILRLTEERARADGARWFCLETSDGEKYRHARRLYELNGLQLLMTVPDFYRFADGSSEALVIYGKPLGEDVPMEVRMPGREVALAA